MNKRPKILFIPLVESKTSERIPMMIRVLSKHYDLIGLRSYFNTLYNKKAFWILCRLKLAILILKGIKLGLKNHVDLIFCEEPEYALAGLIISKVLRKPIIYDSHGNRYLLCMRLNPSYCYRLYAIFLDIIVARMSSLILVVSKHNKKFYVSQGVSPERIRVLPSFVDLNEVDSARYASLAYLKLFKNKRTLLFFGSFQYPPNVKALQFINNELAPALEGIKNVNIYVCGRIPFSGIEHILGSKPHRKLKYLGFVPNIYAVLHAADIFICPIWTTVGIIVKVLDAMAVGKPIVITKFIKEGIPELNENNALIAENKQQFIHLVKYLLDHYDRYKYVAQDLRKIIESKYSMKVIEKQLCSIIQNILERGV